MLNTIKIVSFWFLGYRSVKTKLQIMMYCKSISDQNSKLASLFFSQTNKPVYMTRYSSHWQPSDTQDSLHICAVYPEVFAVHTHRA